MTVEELIVELQKYPKHKTVEIGDIVSTYGEAVRIVEYDETIEIESNNEPYYGGW
jgi:hypothetical protein